MIWKTILTAGRIEDAVIAAAVSNVFGLPASAVHVASASDIYDAGFGVPEPVQVLVERTEEQGDFHQRLEFVLRNGAEDRIEAGTDGEELVQSLCEAWRCRCLIPDDTPNPYRWVLFRPHEKPQIVHLDTERLDAEDEEVVIAHYGDYPDKQKKGAAA